MTARETTQRFRAAMLDADADALAATLAPDAVLHSPISRGRTSQGGRRSAT